MYVNPFWFGVLVTLIVEITALLVYCFWLGGKRRR